MRKLCACILICLLLLTFASCENKDYSASFEEDAVQLMHYGTIDEMSMEEKILASVVLTSIAEVDFPPTTAISPDRFVEFYITLSYPSFDEVEIPEDATTIPAAQLEEVVLRHFDVDVEHIRQTQYYHDDEQVYDVIGIGGLRAFRVTSLSHADGLLSIDYDTFQDTEPLGKGTVEVEWTEGFKYRFVSNIKK